MAGNLTNVGGVSFDVGADGSAASKELQKLKNDLENADKAVKGTKDRFLELAETAEGLTLNTKIAVGDAEMQDARMKVKEFVRENQDLLDDLRLKLAADPQSLTDGERLFIDKFGAMKRKVGELDNAFENVGDKIKTFFNSDVFLNNLFMAGMQLLRNGMTYLRDAVMESIKNNEEAAKSYGYLEQNIKSLQVNIGSVFLPVLKLLFNGLNKLLGVTDEVTSDMKKFNDLLSDSENPVEYAKGVKKVAEEMQKLEKATQLALKQQLEHSIFLKESQLDLIREQILKGLKADSPEYKLIKAYQDYLNGAKQIYVGLKYAVNGVIKEVKTVSSAEFQKILQFGFEGGAFQEALRNAQDKVGQFKNYLTDIKKYNTQLTEVKNAIAKNLNAETSKDNGKDDSKKVGHDWGFAQKAIAEAGTALKEALETTHRIRQETQGLKEKWADLNEEAETLFGNLHRDRKAVEKFKLDFDALVAVTKAVGDEIARFAPETEIWVKHLGNALDVAAQIASGNIVGAIVSGIKAIGDAISDLIGVTDKWQETLDGAMETWSKARDAAVKTWSTMDKKVQLGEMTLEDELFWLKEQLKNAWFLRLSEEDQLDLKLKIKGIEEQITDEKEKQTEEAKSQLELAKSQKEQELERQVSLGLIRAGSVYGSEYIEQTLSSIGYSGSAKYKRMAELGVTSNVINRDVSIAKIETNFYEQNPGQVYRGMAGIVRDVTGGKI